MDYTKFEITDTQGSGLTTATAEQTIRANYPDRLTYKGIEFFDTIYQKLICTEAAGVLSQHSCWQDGQESYLGYLPDKDVFVSGWDTWGREEDNDPKNVVFLKVHSKDHAEVAHVFDSEDYYGMMYGKNGSYLKLKQKFPQLVDIRLD